MDLYLTGITETVIAFKPRGSVFLLLILTGAIHNFAFAQHESKNDTIRPVTLLNVYPGKNTFQILKTTTDSSYFLISCTQPDALIINDTTFVPPVNAQTLYRIHNKPDSRPEQLYSWSDSLGPRFSDFGHNSRLRSFTKKTVNNSVLYYIIESDWKTGKYDTTAAFSFPLSGETQFFIKSVNADWNCVIATQSSKSKKSRPSLNEFTTADTIVNYYYFSTADLGNIIKLDLQTKDQFGGIPHSDVAFGEKGSVFITMEAPLYCKAGKKEYYAERIELGEITARKNLSGKSLLLQFDSKGENSWSSQLDASINQFKVSASGAELLLTGKGKSDIQYTHTNNANSKRFPADKSTNQEWFDFAMILKLSSGAIENCWSYYDRSITEVTVCGPDWLLSGRITSRQNPALFRKSVMWNPAHLTGLHFFPAIFSDFNIIGSDCFADYFFMTVKMKNSINSELPVQLPANSKRIMLVYFKR
jgi:hypothetical protein